MVPEDAEGTYLLYQIRGHRPTSTGASNHWPTLMDVYDSVLPHCTVQSSNTQLRTYLRELLTVVDVHYGDQQVDAPIFVVEGGGPSLLGEIG